MDDPAVVLGFDPGSSSSGWAVAKGGTVLAVGAIKIRGRVSAADTIRHLVVSVEMVLEKWAPDLVVVENQQIHYGSSSPPRDILKLAHIAGGVAGIVASVSAARIQMPLPTDWKGQTKKPINQSRTFTHYGIIHKKGEKYAYPTGCARISKVEGYGQLKQADWYDVGDALGLARYGSALLG